MTKQERIEKLFNPLFDVYRKKITPANEELLDIFRQTASERNVPSALIEELIEFYKISNGVNPCLDGFSFHPCNDTVLYEWWEDYEQLWLGGRDDDLLRWSEGKFCLGDAFDDSYGKEYEFSTLIELLEKGFAEWFPDENTINES